MDELKSIRKILPAVGWLVFITILFCLPGSAIPKAGIFEKLHIDKWVHIFLFATLYYLFRIIFPWKLKIYTVAILLLCVIYGIGIEFIQEWFILNRSFDLYDILADGTGAVLGMFVWLRYIKK